MEHILGKITSVPAIQRPNQDEIVAEWQIGDPLNLLDVRFMLDIITLSKLQEVMEGSNCGMVCLGNLTWRVQLRKSKNGHRYTIVKFNSTSPKPVSLNASVQL